jgi:uncharacterized protein (DUF1501 family)
MAFSLPRRRLLAGVGALAAWAYVPRLAAAPGRDPRLLVVVLRGGLDGLSAVQPVGDPAFQALRGEDAGQAVPLDGFFALNPAMKQVQALYQEKQALLLHAVHTPYRGRSHFDGQDVLESGLPRVTTGDRTGWLNRAMLLLPKGERVAPPRGLAVAPTVPLIMQGRAPIETWQPQRFRYADDETIARLLDLYEARDPHLAESLRAGAALDTMMQHAPREGAMRGPAGIPNYAAETAAAARIMAAPDGPRVAALSFNGWDTHAQQGAAQGRLFNALAGLDGAIGAIREELRPVWDDTVVVVITEFGRTVRLNGTAGTDHGMATCAFILGGAVQGGRVIADWPGLAEAQLQDGRDLRPTMDLRLALLAVLAEQLGLDGSRAAEAIFPGTGALPRFPSILRV